MGRTLTIINGENLFAYYNKIFTLKSLWDLMEENGIEITYSKGLTFKIIGRDSSDQVFTRIKNYGEFISGKGFHHAFSNKIYNKFIKDTKPETILDKLGFDSNDQETITNVLIENSKNITMLDYKVFLSEEYSKSNSSTPDKNCDELSHVEKNIEDLKTCLETQNGNLFIPAYYLAIYNTYITGRVLDNAVGRYVRKLMADKKNTYYTSAKIITILNNDEKNKKKNAEKTEKKNGEGTVLCGEDDFWNAAKKYAGNPHNYMTANEFNGIQIQKICWTAYSLNITETCSKNELLYILLNIDSNFARNFITAAKLKEYKEKLENELKPHFPLYVV